MPKFKPGDFVRMTKTSLKNTTNQRWADEHGYLWLVTGYDYDGDVVCKSLATGATERTNGGKFWFRSNELEKADA